MINNPTSRFINKGIFFAFGISLLFILSCSEGKYFEDHPEYFDEVINKAKNQADSGFPMEAFAYLDSCYAAFKSPSNFDLFRKYQLKCDYYHIERKDYKQANKYVDSMVLVLSDHPELHVNSYSHALITKGHIHFSSHNYIEAFKSYYDGKEFATKYGDSCSYAAVSKGLALVLFAQQKYSEAISYFKAADKELRYCFRIDSLSTFQLRQGYMNNIALCYEMTNLFDSAIYSYKKALNYVESQQTNSALKLKSKQIAIAVIYGNLGGTYAKMGNYREAERLLKISIRTNNKLGYDRRDAQLTIIKLAQMYIDIGRMEEAKQYINLARIAIDSLSFDMAELRWKKLAWEYYDKTGNTQQAYLHYRQYTDYKSAYDSVRRELSGADFSETFENLSQQYQIDILKKDNKLKTLYLLISTTLGAMVLLVVYLIWRSNRISKINIKELTKLNGEISDLNILKDKILAILAHDIRGPLASITGLLNAEDQHINPEMAIEARHKLRNQLIVVNELLDNLLHWASSSFKNKTNFDTEVISISDAIQKNIEILKGIAEDKQIKIINNVPEEWKCEVNVEQLKIVFRNLLANSIKFTPHGGQIQFDIENINGLILISITDTGIGMNKDQIDRLFSNKHNSSLGTKGEKGIGLGLLISKEYLESNGGSIRIESIEGKGTKAIVSLKYHNQHNSD